MTNTLPTGFIKALSGVLSEPNRNASAFNTNVQHFVRLGRKWTFSLTLRAMSHGEARQFWMLHANEPVLCDIVQREAPTINEGTPLVDGAGQLGSTLNVDGLTVGETIEAGRFISIVTNSRRYVYQVTADATASGVGEAALSIQPPLRVIPNNNDTVEIAAPKVEGYVSGFRGFGGAPNGGVAETSFTIEERG